MDEGFGYCEYCYDDDFYPYATCGGRQRDQVVINYTDDVVSNSCDCDFDHHLVDGHCTTCGQNCNNCDLNRCTECDFGFMHDHTETVCVDFCPTGSVFDSASNSGSCVTDVNQYGLLDFVFDCVTPITNSLDEVIQRSFTRSNAGYDINGSSACYDYALYGGANAGSIEFDDPTPIPDRGYWFNGECKFLTLEGFVPSLSTAYTAWLKPHDGTGTLYQYTPVVQANQAQHNYNELRMAGGNSVCWESTHGQMKECLSVGFEMFEWNQYSFTMETWRGVTSYAASVNGAAVASSDNNQSIMRIFDEVDFTFGAGVKHGAAGLETADYYKGFQYTLRFGTYVSDAAEFANFNAIQNFAGTSTDICTCDSHDCPLTGGCLGVCNWNFYWDEGLNKCQRCPYWCHMGCDGNGMC